VHVHGKGNTERQVWLSADARGALADYLDHERPADTSVEATALFLAASSIASRRADGRLAVRTINHVCERISGWHDGETTDTERQLGALSPHEYADLFVMPTSVRKSSQIGLIGA
jgi:integrase